MRCGGTWKRDYGDSYTGTQGETPDTAKEPPTDYRASSRPYQPEAATVPGEDCLGSDDDQSRPRL